MGAATTARETAGGAIPAGWPTGADLPVASHTATTDLTVYLAVGFLAGLAAIYLGAKRWRVGQLVRNTATERVRSAAVGRTELEGVCRDVGITYEQPYADGSCVYRHWVVEEYARTGGNDDSRSWRTVDAGTDVAPFLLEDETGRILVDTTQEPYFDISEANSYTTTVAAGAEPPDAVQSFSPDADADVHERLEGTLLGEAAEAALGDGTVDRMVGAGDTTGAAGDRPATREEVLEEYVDDRVLDENGELREDVTAVELQQAMDDEAPGVGAGDLFGGTTGGDDGDGGERDTGSEAAGGDAIVAELGGTGDAGDMGTGSSLAGALVGRVLGAATGGRVGHTGSGLFSASGAPNSGNKRRYSHEVLPVDETVYVFGATEPRTGANGPDASNLKLGIEPATGRFIVSDREDRVLVSHYTRRGLLYVVAGLVVSTGCLAGLLWSLGLA